MADVSVYDYGAVGDGSTDDLGAINTAISTAGRGGTVNFPARNPAGGISNFGISAPIVLADDGISLLGDGAGVTNSGAGSGSGTFSAGHDTGANQITGTIIVGPTISPLSTFSIGSANQSACVVIDGTINGKVERNTVERLNFYGGNAGLTLCHGVVTNGPSAGPKIANCGFYVFYNASSDGIHVYEDASANSADGIMINDCMLQFIGNDGIHCPGGDATITRVHTQTVGGYGFYVSTQGYSGSTGGNTRLTDCRGDLSATDGYFIGVGCGEYLGMVQLDNCSTQRNQQNGFHIRNNVSGAKTCPVYASNCVAQGDGIAGGSNAGYRIAGPVGVSLENCATHVDTVDVSGGAPNYGIVTASDGITAPVFVSVIGGFYNGVTAWSNKINAPLVSTTQTLSYSGGQWNPGHTPTVRTAL